MADKLTSLLPQGPNVHCGEAFLHEKHANRTNTILDNAWCDGVPPLEPFVELSIRVPMGIFFGDAPEGKEHTVVLEWLADEGLAIIVDEMTEAATSVLRIRTADGIDRVYPLLKKDMPDGCIVLVPDAG